MLMKIITQSDAISFVDGYIACNAIILSIVKRLLLFRQKSFKELTYTSIIVKRRDYRYIYALLAEDI